MKAYSLEEIKKYIPTITSFYKILTIDKGFYLPSEDSKAISERYLLSVAKKEIYTIQLKDVSWYPLDIKFSREEIFSNICQKQNANFGFNSETLPDKPWLINILRTLDPGSKLFKEPVIEITRELPIG